MNLGFGVLGACVLTGYAVLGLSELLWAWSTVQLFLTCCARGSPWAPEAAEWVLILIQEETWASLIEGLLKSILVNLSVSQGPSEGQQ